MNRENITKVRDVIAALPAKKFNMNFWGNYRDTNRSATTDEVLNNCGTCACIGGWTNAIFGGNYLSGSAANTLGLNPIISSDLFYPDQIGEACDDITQAQAVRVLDILLETGEVDWERAIREVPAP